MLAHYVNYLPIHPYTKNHLNTKSFRKYFAKSCFSLMSKAHPSRLVHKPMPLVWGNSIHRGILSASRMLLVELDTHKYIKLDLKSSQNLSVIAWVLNNVGERV